MAAGTTAVATGLTALGTVAVKSYADFEQLKGGIETLFGTGGKGLQEYAESVEKTTAEVETQYNQLIIAQNKAMDNSSKAYKTAGLSANAYMEVVTGMAAALKQSTGSELEAAKAADQAIIDMSDNANKMGTSMELIQNAYQGFSKQNYTMLDNLKLGYGGTKEEMQRLLADAEKLSGVKYDISSLSDVYEAIHVVQTELGITGTTAFEAATTISGSANMMKAAWSNLLAGMADDNQDFEQLVNDLVESTVVAGENILPRVEQVINGCGELVEALLPQIMQRVPQIISDVLPDVVEAGVNIIVYLVSGIRENLPEILNAGGQILGILAEGISEAMPDLLTVAIDIIVGLINGMAENVPEMTDTALAILTKLGSALVEGAPELAEATHGLIDAILDELEELCPAISPITDAVQLLIDNFDKLIPVVESVIIVFAGLKAGMAIQSAVQSFQKAQVALALFATQANSASLAQAALNGTITLGETIVALLTGKMTLAQLASAGLAKAQGVLNAVIAANPIVLIVTAIAALVAAFLYLWNTNEEFRQFWINLWDSIKVAAEHVINALIKFFTETIPNAISNLVGFVKDNWQALLMMLNPATILAGIFKIVYDNCEGFRTFIDEFTQSVKELLVNTWDAIVSFFTETIPAFINDIVMFFSQLPDRIGEFLGNILTNAITWGTELVTSGVQTATNFVNQCAELIGQLPGRIAEFLNKIIADVIVWASDMLINAQKAATDFISTTSNIIATLPGKIAGFLSTIIANVIKWAADMLSNGQKAGNDFITKVVEYISQLPGKIQGFINQIISTITTFVTNMGNKAAEAGRGFYDRIVGALSGLPGKMTEIGSNIISGIWNGISSGWSWLTGKVSELANSLFDAAKQALDINSPSRKFKWIAEMCVAGWDEGAEGLMDPDIMTRNVKAGLASMQAAVSVQSNGKTGDSNTINQTININKELATADEMARAIRIESRYGLMRGVPVGT